MTPNPDTSPIFVFASGQRCGSTLLQRFLCTHPDLIVWGEHDGVLEKIFAGFERLDEWHDMFHHHYETYMTLGPVDNFIPNLTPPREHIRHSQSEVVRNLWQRTAHAHGKTWWGFKEVLYGADMALKLRALFPSARVIHLTRHVFGAFTSLLNEERLKPGENYVPLKELWTRARTIEWIARYVRINRSFYHTPGLSPDWVYHLRYEDLTENTAANVRKLTDWLCLDYHAFNHDVFQHKIYTDRVKGHDLRPRITWDDLSGEEYALVMSDEVLEVANMLHYVMPQRKALK